MASLPADRRVTIYLADYKMRIFNRDNNPYARDLLRLRFAPEQRYTFLEMVVLGRVIAAKLYELEPEIGYRFGRSRLWRNLGDGCAVELHVVFDDAIRAGRLYRRLRRYRSRPERQLIVLIVGEHGVVEVFNGFQGELELEGLAQALDAMRGSGDAYSPPLPDVVQPRRDAVAAEDYRGVRGTTGNDRAAGGTIRSGGNGRGNDNERRDGGNNRGNGGDGGNDGTDGPRRTPGRGGAGELVNHPVLFTVEQHVYDAILDEI